jgi:hypothetical protein
MLKKDDECKGGKKSRKQREVVTYETAREATWTQKAEKYTGKEEEGKARGARDEEEQGEVGYSRPGSEKCVALLATSSGWLFTYDRTHSGLASYCVVMSQYCVVICECCAMLSRCRLMLSRCYVLLCEGSGSVTRATYRLPST